MKGTQNSVLIALGITLLFTSGCYKRVLLEHGPGAGHHYGQQDQRVFEVYIYADPGNPGYCLADWPVGTLWKDKHQTVTWFSDDGLEYTVDFTKGKHASPFPKGTTFTVTGAKEQSSGPLDGNANGYYDFAIYAGHDTGPSVKPCKDPSDPGYYVK